jgi:hypothetical protein
MLVNGCGHILELTRHGNRVKESIVAAGLAKVIAVLPRTARLANYTGE